MLSKSRGGGKFPSPAVTFIRVGNLCLCLAVNIFDVFLRLVRFANQ